MDVCVCVSMLGYAMLINIRAFICLQRHMLCTFTITHLMSSKVEDKRKEGVTDPTLCLLVIMSPRLAAVH